MSIAVPPLKSTTSSRSQVSPTEQTVIVTEADVWPARSGSELSAEGTARHVSCFLGPLRDPQTHIARIEMSDRGAVLDQDPGKYALDCSASWPQGSHVPFTFGIEILPPGL